MRTRFLGSLIVALCILIGVGPAGASTVGFPDGSGSQAIPVGNGVIAFVFLTDLVPPDIYIHAVNSFGDLVPVNLAGFVGSAILLSFEGFTPGGLTVYGVYTCNNANLVSCNVSNTRRGTFFL